MSTSPSPLALATGTPLTKQDAASSLHRMQFPYKLHRILEDASKKEFDDIIAWSPHGRSFRVFSKERFEQEVMDQYFDSNKYKTFQRNLNLWGYQVGENKDIVHEHFVRGKLDLCEKMHRVKIKGAYIRGTRNAKTAIHKQTASIQLPQISSFSPPLTSQFQERAKLLSLMNTTHPGLQYQYSFGSAVQKHQQEVEARATALMARLVAEERSNRQLAPSLLPRDYDPVARALLSSMDIAQSTSLHTASLLEAARMKSMSHQLHHYPQVSAPTQGYNMSLLEALLTSGSRK